MPDYYAIEPAQLDRLAAVAKRLYSEDRMTGDDMRNAAQTIDYIVGRARELPVPDAEPTPAPAPHSDFTLTDGQAQRIARTVVYALTEDNAIGRRAWREDVGGADLIETLTIEVDRALAIDK